MKKTSDIWGNILLHSESFLLLKLMVRFWMQDLYLYFQSVVLVRLSKGHEYIFHH